jgi:hypothetical protein
MFNSFHSHGLTAAQQIPRKSAVSILPVSLKNIKSTRRAVKSEIISKVGVHMILLFKFFDKFLSQIGIPY